MEPEVILVTGGSGLLGHAIQWAIQQEDLQFGSRPHERWVFLRSADGDLR
jgi:GDP-L-fucose synthase